MKRKDLTTALEKVGFSYDKLVAKKDGTFEVMHGYFYTHGFTPEKWATRVADALAAAKQNAWFPADVKVEVVSFRDAWAAWPKDSYFVAVVKAS